MKKRGITKKELLNLLKTPLEHVTQRWTLHMGENIKRQNKTIQKADYSDTQGWKQCPFLPTKWESIAFLWSIGRVSRKSFILIFKKHTKKHTDEEGNDVPAILFIFLKISLYFLLFSLLIFCFSLSHWFLPNLYHFLLTWDYSPVSNVLKLENVISLRLFF